MSLLDFDFFNDLLHIDFSQFLADILNALLYPLQVIFGHIYVIFSIIIDSFIGLYDSFASLFSSVYSLFTAAFQSWLPSPWMALIFLIFTVVFLLRVYSFLKDIEIWGFKI